MKTTFTIKRYLSEILTAILNENSLENFRRPIVINSDCNTGKTYSIGVLSKQLLQLNFPVDNIYLVVPTNAIKKQKEQQFRNAGFNNVNVINYKLLSNNRFIDNINSNDLVFIDEMHQIAKDLNYRNEMASAIEISTKCQCVYTTGTPIKGIIPNSIEINVYTESSTLKTTYSNYFGGFVKLIRYLIEKTDDKYIFVFNNHKEAERLKEEYDCVQVTNKDTINIEEPDNTKRVWCWTSAMITGYEVKFKTNRTIVVYAGQFDPLSCRQVRFRLRNDSHINVVRVWDKSSKFSIPVRESAGHIVDVFSNKRIDVNEATVESIVEYYNAIVNVNKYENISKQTYIFESYGDKVSECKYNPKVVNNWYSNRKYKPVETDKRRRPLAVEIEEEPNSGNFRRYDAQLIKEIAEMLRIPQRNVKKDGKYHKAKGIKYRIL